MTISRVRFSASTALAGAPGRAASVPLTRIPPTDTRTSPNCSSPKAPVTVSSEVMSTTIDSNGSRSASVEGMGSTTGAGTAAPLLQTSTAALPTSELPTCVRVKNSSTVPRTVTTSPTETSAGDQTKMPSEVAASPSPASWMVNPLRPGVSEVTVPIRVTCWFSTGLTAPLPWTAPMVEVVGVPHSSGSGSGSGSPPPPPTVSLTSPKVLVS